MLALPRGMIPRFTGIVLAGGQSRRMGTDKAMLERSGVSLLDRAIALLRDAGAVDVRVGGDRPGHCGIPDLRQGRGPVGGLEAVLAQCPDGPAIVVAVDQPALDVATLRRLLGALAHAPAAAYAGHPLPWAVTIDLGVRQGVAALLDQMPSGPSMRQLHARVAGIELPLAAPSALVNVNTPADWAALP